MKYVKYLFFGFVIVLMIALPLTFDEEAEISGISVDESPRSPVRLAYYTEQNAILIQNNTDFMWQAGNESWDGDGSEGNPYIIKGYNITNDSICIEIYDVSAHFIITDCLLSSETAPSDSGIRFSNVSHGRIENCTIMEKSRGIWISYCNNTFIYNNTVCFNFLDGIYLQDTVDCDIIDNTIYENSIFYGGCGILLNNANRTTIVGNFIHNDYSDGVEISSSYNCSLYHNEISWTWGQGVYISSSDNCVLYNNSIHDNYNGGVKLENSDYCTILNNSIYENYNGIHPWNCDSLNITENFVFQNDGYGVICEDCSNITLYNNEIHDSTQDGVYTDTCTNLLLVENEVHSNTATGIRLDDSDNCNLTESIVYNNTLHGIHIWAQPGENFTLLENIVYDNQDNGILLRYGTNCYLKGNTIYNNTNDGINLVNFQYCTIENNIIKNNGWADWPPIVGSGIYASQSHWISVAENTIFNNSEDGFHLRNSENWTIHNNTVYYNWGLEALTCGIYLYNIGLSNITSNMVYNNTENGIYAELMYNCTFISNIIFNNTEFGVYLINCDNNILYENDIGWNIQGNASDNAGDNFWNSSLNIGNFWSNYNWEDNYPINGTANSMDYHPWFSLYVGVSDDVEYELGDTGNTLIWNSTAANPWKYEVYVDRSWILESGTWEGDVLVINVDGFDAGYYEITLVVYHISGHHLSSSAFVTVEDTVDPTWDIAPSNQMSEFGDSFSYDLDASDIAGIDKWWLNTTYFDIDDEGVIKNATSLPIGIYWIQVSVNDTNGNVLTSSFKVTMEDTTDPTWFEEPQDQVVELGASFSYDLDASDLSPLDSWWLNTTDFAIDEEGTISNAIALSVGTYAIEVLVNDTSGNVLTGTFTVTVEDTTEPTWNPMPTDQVVEYGTPFRYDLNATDLSVIDYWAVNGTSFAIDSNGVLTNATVLALGEYWLLVEVHDQYDNSKDYTFKVIVVDTTLPIFIATPEDVEAEEGTTVILLWNVTDLCPSSHSIFLDGELLTDGEWNSNMTFIVVAIVGLEPGVYNVTITIEDCGGNTATDSVVVEITEIIITTTTTTVTTTTTITEPETTTTTSPPVFPIDPTTLTIVAAGIGGAIAVIIVVIIISKSRGSG